MGTPIDYIYENALQVQPSFKGELNVSGRFGYRGELLIASGSKVMLKHAIVVSDKDSVLLFAAELKNFDDFKTAFDSYHSLFTDTTLVTLFVNNIISDVVFEYEGITVYAFALDESSVWNELISYAELDKRELKRMDPDKKLDSLYDGLKVSTLYASKKTYEEACQLKIN
jgi:hypothetical protein